MIVTDIYPLIIKESFILLVEKYIGLYKSLFKPGIHKELKNNNLVCKQWFQNYMDLDFIYNSYERSFDMIPVFIKIKGSPYISFLYKKYMTESKKLLIMNYSHYIPNLRLDALKSFLINYKKTYPETLIYDIQSDSWDIHEIKEMTEYDNRGNYSDKTIDSFIDLL